MGTELEASASKKTLEEIIKLGRTEMLAELRRYTSVEDHKMISTQPTARVRAHLVFFASPSSEKLDGRTQQ